MTWTLAAIAALEDTRWPERHRREADLAAWLDADTAAAADRHWRILTARHHRTGLRVQRLAEEILTRLPAESQRDVAERRAVLAGYDDAPSVPPHLVGAVWRWGAA